MGAAEKLGVGLRMGDLVVVHQMPVLARVCSIEPPDYAGRVKVWLDWGEHGKSRIWLHDEGSVWTKYVGLN